MKVKVFQTLPVESLEEIAKFILNTLEKVGGEGTALEMPKVKLERKV